jgi:hypothetical protein
MEKLVTLPTVPSSVRPTATGLGAILCYDPYFPRMLRGVKKALAAGHPVFVRLHPAAQYPTADARRYRNDLESHGVLIVGYDDAREALAIWDPWNNAWGGSRGGLRWVGYAELALLIVNSTKDCNMILAPLQVEAQLSEADGLALEVSAGFYVPDAIVMDQDNFALTEVRVEVALPSGWLASTSETRVAGFWKVGEHARLRFPLSAIAGGEASVKLSVSASVVGQRPYPFEDTIAVQTVRSVCVDRPRVALAG